MSGKRKIHFNSAFTIGNELKYIQQAVENLRLSGNGPFSKKCQQWLEDNLGCKKALLTHSGTGALEMMALLCRVGPGDEVIMPSFTFVSTANAFALQGATPVFVDIRPHDMNIDPELVADAVTPRTKVIVPVHYAGHPCDMERINEIARRKNLFVVEDAAHAFLIPHKGRHLGTWGNLGCLSFHETKNIICGEGGALLINDPVLMDRAEIIWEKGTNRKDFSKGTVAKYTWVDLGSSYYPNEITSAFLFAQLERCSEIIGRRKTLHRHYYQRLRALHEKGMIGLDENGLDESSTCHIFYLFTRDKAERARLINYLAGLEIMSVFHFVPLHSSEAGKKYGRVHGAMTITDDYSDRLLRLPLHYQLTENEVDEVCDAVYRFYGFNPD